MRALLATITSSALALATAATAAPVDAKQAPPVALAIGGVEVTGAQSDAVQPVVTRAVRVGLRAPETGPDVPSCVTATCLAEAARNHRAERVIAASIAVSGEFFDQYAITIAIADTEGRALRRRTDTCKGCSVGEATDRVTAMVADIAGASADDEVEVEIATTPAGTAVTVDGTARGASPWRGKLPAGAHQAQAGGVVRDFFVGATGEPVRLDLALPIGPGREPRFGPILTYGTAAVGAGAIVFGAVLLARDGDPTCPSPGCPEVHDTALPGWIALGAGVAALGAAGYFWWDDRKASRPVVVVAPTSDGVAAFATGTF